MKKEIPKKRGTVFRKVLSLMTVILLLCSVLTSCSGKTPEGETQTGPPDAASDASPDPGVTTAAPKPTGPPLTATGETNWQAVLKQSAAVVYLTINPELALYVDENNIVICADCLNDDAKEAYSDISFSGKTIDECTKEVIETAIEKEYLTEAKEVKVDIAVLSKSADSAALKEKTQETVSQTAAQHEMTVNVVAAELEQHGKILCDECLGSGKCIYCDTCGPCELCFGKGATFCELCNEGYITCFNCGGNTETEQFITAMVTMEVEYCKACGHKVSETDVTCPACNGTGKNPCHMCGGVGRTFCTECGGKGYGISDKTKEKVACGRCGGTGLKHCNECDGTGYEKGECPIYCNHPGDRHEFRTETVETEIDNPNWCPACQGQGKYLCNVCHGHYTDTCPACEGTGITPCGMCTEQGAHKKGVCSRCLGSGLIDP
ncbi:MAG: hypothetical protein K6E42_08595 [Synergistes sp.]|nr:hypothetical protein [Synergistes sp.]